MMLRPDFTVPIVRLHMDARRRAGALRLLRAGLAAAGGGSDRPREFLQAGFELFEARRSGGDDAEVLALIVEALGTRRSTGHRRPRAGAGGDRRARHQRRAQGGAAAACLAAGAVPCAAASTSASGMPGRGRGGRRCSPPRRRADARRWWRRGRGGGAARAPTRWRRGWRGWRRRRRRRRWPAATGADRGGAGGEGPRRRRWPSCGAGARAAGAGGGGGPASRRGWRPSRRAESRRSALRFEASFGRTSLEYYDGFVFGALPRGRTTCRRWRAAGATTR